MLIVKIQVNENEIDSVYIQNMKETNQHGESLYEIKKPKKLQNIKIWHRRSLPWYYLVQQVCSVMIENEK